MDIKLSYRVDAENPIPGDIFLQNGQMVLTSEVAEATAQRLRIRLCFFKGEWYLDQRLGIPYFSEVFVKNPNLNRLKSMFRSVILSTEGVATVSRLKLTMDRETRAATLTFKALTTDGVDLDFSEPFIVTLP